MTQYDRAEAKELYLKHTPLTQIAQITGIPRTTLQGWVYQGVDGDPPWRTLRATTPGVGAPPPPAPTKKHDDAPDPEEALKYLKRIWTPHGGQERVREAIFESLADLVYVECGRKFGKSEFATWVCWLLAVMKPNSEIYYLAPAVKQARELVWANYRMQSCNTYSGDFKTEIEAILGGPLKIKDQEMRIYLPNGSFIKVDGSDNYNMQRGLKPDFVVADEYRDFKKEWIEAVRPNMAVKGGKMLFITTPPHSPNHAHELALEAEQNASGRNFYLNLPSYVNDTIPNFEAWLEGEKQRLLSKGRENEWRREYLAEFIPNSENMIIPQLNPDILVAKSTISDILAAKKSNVQDYTAIHTGNTANFTALTAKYDPYTGELIVTDCLVEANPENTSVRKIWPRLQAMISANDMTLDSVTIVYNRDATWFGRDLADAYGIQAIPSGAADSKAQHNISLIKDIITADKLWVSELAKELVDQAGEFCKIGEHCRIPLQCPQAIDCLKYILTAAGYTSELAVDPPTPPQDEQFIQWWLEHPSAQERYTELMDEKYGRLNWLGEE